MTLIETFRNVPTPLTLNITLIETFRNVPTQAKQRQFKREIGVAKVRDVMVKRVRGQVRVRPSQPLLLKPLIHLGRLMLTFWASWHTVSTSGRQMNTSKSSVP